MKQIKIHIRLILIALFLLNISPSAFAQQTGTLKGQILDLSETGVPWGKITVGNQTTSYETEPDKDGRYQLTLPEGTYNLIVRANGFLRSRKRQIKITANQVLEINITMHTQTEYVYCLAPDSETQTGKNSKTKTSEKSPK